MNSTVRSKCRRAGKSLDFEQKSAPLVGKEDRVRVRRQVTTREPPSRCLLPRYVLCRKK